MEPRGQELIKRYKKNYNIPDNAIVTEDMILFHWELEKELTNELLNSTKENRWKVFEKCYTRLYAELSWLNDLTETEKKDQLDKQFTKWIKAIGPAPKTIYEIGSGKGELISYLANYGYKCKGTEVTAERGESRLKNKIENLEWAITNGVNLDKFEEKLHFDILISNHVIEHLHPEDIIDHFSSAHKILKQSGKYIICTPHQFTGPHDVSRVFQHEKPMGMHLKEYTYTELSKLALQAGFNEMYYSFVPDMLTRIFQIITFGKASESKESGTYYLRFIIFLETLLLKISNLRLRKKITTLLWKIKLFPNNINLVIQKA